MVEPISRKDKLALAVSTVALLISGSTLLLNRWDKHQSDRRLEAKTSYAAFQLGKRFANAFVIYVHTREGAPKAVAQAKEEALAHARQAQAYAETLDLRMDLAELIARYRYDDSQVIGEVPVTTIETRLEANHGRELSRKFAVAYWLAWLRFNAQAAIVAHPDNLPAFRKDYAVLARMINQDLAALGLGERLSAEMPDLETGKAETLKALDALDAKLRS
jgi:hypothetical protein